MATLEGLLASLLNPNPGVQRAGLLGPNAMAQTGLGPEQLARYHQMSGLGGGAPQAAPSAPSMPSQAPQAPDQMQTASTAPAGILGGLGDAIGGLFNPKGANKNRTVQLLMQDGLDEGTATLVAQDKGSLNMYLRQRAFGEGPKADEYQQRTQVAQQYGLNGDEAKSFILTGKMPEKPSFDFITGRDGSIFRADPTQGSIDQVYGGKPDQPTDVQEYEYAKGQGYQGSFQQFQIEQKRAGASQVNIDQKAEGAFDKKLAENQATIFTEMATEGMHAKADTAVLGELEGLLGQTGGTLSGISGALAKYGIGGAGMSDIQAAQALINKLVPTQRQPGSGTMSDRDVELFTRSLPSLWNAPGGNAKILSVMKGLAQYKQQQGQIATAVMNGEMTRQDAAKALQSLPNPLAEFKPQAGAASKSFTDQKQIIQGIQDGTLKIGDEIIFNGERMRIDP